MLTTCYQSFVPVIGLEILWTGTLLVRGGKPKQAKVGLAESGALLLPLGHRFRWSDVPPDASPASLIFWSAAYAVLRILQMTPVFVVETRLTFIRN